MEIKYPNWLPKIFGSPQTSEEMNGIVEVLQNHAETLSLHDIRILAALSGIYTDALTPSSEVPTEVGDKVFLVTQPGTYTNFGNVVLPANHFGFIFKNGSSFTIQSVEMPAQDLTDVYNEINQVDNKYEVLYKNKPYEIETDEIVEIHGLVTQGSYITSQGVISSGNSIRSYYKLEVKKGEEVFYRNYTDTTSLMISVEDKIPFNVITSAGELKERTDSYIAIDDGVVYMNCRTDASFTPYLYKIGNKTKTIEPRLNLSNISGNENEDRLLSNSDRVPSMILHDLVRNHMRSVVKNEQFSILDYEENKVTSNYNQMILSSSIISTGEINNTNSLVDLYIINVRVGDVVNYKTYIGSTAVVFKRNSDEKFLAIKGSPTSLEEVTGSWTATDDGVIYMNCRKKEAWPSNFTPILTRYGIAEYNWYPKLDERYQSKTISINFSNWLKKYTLTFIDNIPDVTIPLQEAIYHLERIGGGSIWIDKGNYICNNVFLRNNVNIFGEGMYLTTFFTTKTYPAFKSVNGPSYILKNVQCRDFGINGEKVVIPPGESYTSREKGFFATYIKRCHFENIYICNTGGTGFGCDYLDNCTINNMVTENCGRLNPSGTTSGGAGIGIGTGKMSATRESLLISNCDTRNNGSYGIFIETQPEDGSSPNGITVVNCYSEGNRHGFGISGGEGVIFSNCIAYDNHVSGFTVDKGTFGLRKYKGKTIFSNCVATKTGYTKSLTESLPVNTGNGFEITHDYGLYISFNECKSYNNEGHGAYISKGDFISIDGGDFIENKGHGININGNIPNLFITPKFVNKNANNGININGNIMNLILDGILSENLIGLNITQNSIIQNKQWRGISISNHNSDIV
ncbi:right-handed parallel beta-helix repeat-containing protein [Empedobacter falsenii]|uniref:right-handed parallel beta-helix repeat-containing protein n=1 Tax=Empedobacter falsenii TaxID=343874 RepID=UPI001C8EDAA6|nr:right-handed parallel beta-helix repeat-containing protein [Empedobacter falsenii]MBY0066802.1 right-handed parallel beta-helix repeat-containing protein [Empedobacter falsenii]